MSVASNKSNPGPILASDSYYNSNTLYNEKLDPNHVDVPENDVSIMGQLVRSVASLVGGCFSPQRLIVVFRLLKALTFCCLCASIVAECMYLFFVELQVSHDVLKKIGGTRDEVLRLYGIGLAFFAIFIELDMTVVDKYYPFMKGFLLRSGFLFFITTLGGTSPIIGYENSLFSKYRNYDDDGYTEYTSDSALISNEVPGSAVAFQATTTFFLFICAATYFCMGILCLDRFTSDAFLSEDDPASGGLPMPSETRSTSHNHGHASSSHGHGNASNNLDISVADSNDESYAIEYYGSQKNAGR